MYTRRYYEQPQQRIKIPENYNGHAFSEPLRYNAMPPPAKIPSPHSDLPPSVRAESLDEYIQNGSQKSPEDIQQNKEKDLTDSTEEKPLQTSSGEKNDPVNSSTSVASLLSGSSLFANRFPFGHGIGSEELLILAIMLLVYLSGEQNHAPDTEFMLLLGLLLFAG